MLGALLAAGPLMRFLGFKVEAVITRLLGVLLAALGGAVRDRRAEGVVRLNLACSQPDPFGPGAKGADCVGATPPPSRAGTANPSAMIAATATPG